MDMETEIWKDIKGYEGKYQVSNFGRVKSLPTIITRADGGKGTIQHRKEHISYGSGTRYNSVKLYKDGKKVSKRVSRLVWEAFNGDIPEGMEVNHIDENRKNNRLDNLNLMTPQENSRWGTRTSRIVGHAKKEKPVQQLTLDGLIVNQYKSVREASRQTGICPISIMNVCNNKPRYNTAGGYKWKYLN